jgi:thiol:disulfide interchange protein DsbD
MLLTGHTLTGFFNNPFHSNHSKVIHSMSFIKLVQNSLLGLMFGLTLNAPQIASADDLLPPEQAFHATAEIHDSTLDITYHVAEGYHLYQDKLEIKSDTSNLELGKPVLPEGVIDNDPYLGKLIVYKKDFSVGVSITKSVPGPVTLTLKYQGCSDTQGVCYPPQTQLIQLTLPTMSAPIASSSQTASLDSLASNMGAESNQTPLEPEQAFKNDTAQLSWTIAKGYYLYRDRIKVGLANSDASIIGTKIGAGEAKDDPTFGKTYVFHNDLTTKVELKPGASKTAVLVAGYQGCAELGLCYPPMERAWTIDLSSGSVTPLTPTPKTTLKPIADYPSLTGAEMSTATPSATTAPAQAQQSQTDAITQELKTGSIWTIVFGFLVIGLLLAFTPCVFPMIPILAGIIAGQGEHITTRKAFVLSLVYVLAMAITYTIAGILAGLFGSNLQAAFQNPWILSAFAAIFVALAFSMFGFFELQLPSALQSKIMQVQNEQQGGTLIGVAIMGLLSALIVGPCMAPPLAGALIYIGQTGDAALGGIALFAMSIGMGLPLIIVGTLGGKFLPRAGAWMDAVKNVFGVLMLGVAIWMLERIIPSVVAQVLWGILVIGSAIYLGAAEPIKAEASGWSRLWKTLGVIMLLWGALIFVGVAAGGKGSVFAPLTGLNLGGGSAQQTQAKLNFTKIKNISDLDQQIALAKAAGKPVMLDFYADWCVSCKEMEHNTFSDPKIIQALQPFVLLQADVTANNADDKALFKRFGVLGPPTIVFFGSQGQELKAQQVVGYENADRFMTHITAASH